MKIYMFYYKDVLERFPDYNEFTPSEWNDKDELPRDVIDLVDIAYENDTVFTEFNFMLCFNLQDKETYHGDWIMFVPDERFADELSARSPFVQSKTNN